MRGRRLEERLGVAGGGPLVTVSKDRFRNPRGSLSFMSQDQFELNFLSQDQFELKSLEGNTTINFTRLSGR